MSDIEKGRKPLRTVTVAAAWLAYSCIISELCHGFGIPNMDGTTMTYHGYGIYVVTFLLVGSAAKFFIHEESETRLGEVSSVVSLLGVTGLCIGSYMVGNTAGRDYYGTSRKWLVENFQYDDIWTLTVLISATIGLIAFLIYTFEQSRKPK